MKMVVGLGNPGLRYRRTRHNVGFQVLEAMARASGIRWKRKRKLSSLLGQGRWGGEEVILVKPTTFVNLSGEAVGKVMAYFHLIPRDLIIVVDDVSLSPGLIRIRARGGAGGHHGLESVIRHLGTRDFPRIRIGIGGGGMESLTNHVLTPPSKEEEAAYRKAVESVLQAVAVIFENGLEKAMNDFNRKMITREEEQQEVDH